MVAAASTSVLKNIAFSATQQPTAPARPNLAHKTHGGLYEDLSTLRSS